MKSKTHKMNGLIDAVLFGGFVLACFLKLTGQAAHQWLGIAVGGLALYHLWRHQVWVAAAARRWFGGLAGRARLYSLLDLGLLAGLGGIIVTGVVISSWLNLQLGDYAVWRDWHVAMTLGTLGLLVAKLGLHWRWIAQALRAPARPTSPARLALPAVAAAAAPAGAVGRRDFLKVMGAVSVAALVTGAQIVASQAAATLPVQQIASAAASSSNASTATTITTASNSTSATTCQVRCNRRCSYPGHCRRYTDANQNGRCDWGECS